MLVTVANFLDLNSFKGSTGQKGEKFEKDGKGANPCESFKAGTETASINVSQFAIYLACVRSQ